MRLGTPRWWYVRHGAPGAVTRLLLRPLSWIWAAATARRIARGAPVDPGAPVISIGNLTMGGSGKTPVAREVLKEDIRTRFQAPFAAQLGGADAELRASLITGVILGVSFARSVLRLEVLETDAGASIRHLHSALARIAADEAEAA